MTSTVTDRKRLGLQRWPIATLVVVGVSAPVVKTVSLLRDWPDWTHQLLIAPLTLIAATVAVLWRHQDALSVREARPGDGCHELRVPMASLGLLPMWAPRGWTRRRVGRLLLGLTAAALAVVAAGPLETAGRIVLLCGAGVLFGTLVEIERRREKKWLSDEDRVVRPDRAVLWAVSPLVVAAGGATAALAVQGSEGELSWKLMAELVFITALGEELIFRGALLAIAYRAVPPIVAELATALSFGFWHLGNALNDTRGDEGPIRVVVVAGTVAFTAAGGLVFSWFRHRTRSLLGPTCTHVATNLPGIALG